MRLALGGVVAILVVANSRATAVDWILDLDGRLSLAYMSSVGEAVTGMASQELTRFGNSYGFTSGNFLSHDGMADSLPGFGIGIRKQIGAGWGCRFAVGLSRIAFTAETIGVGLGGEKLTQDWNLELGVIPVLAGLWMESVTEKGFVLRGNASVGITNIQGYLEVNRQFFGPGGTRHYWGHNFLSGWGPTFEMSGSLGYRVRSYLEVFLDGGIVAVSPFTLAFKNAADINLDGVDDFQRGEILRDQFNTPATLDLTNWQARLGVAFRL